VSCCLDAPAKPGPIAMEGRGRHDICIQAKWIRLARLESVDLPHEGAISSIL
jgi:hypothetical protein